MSQFTYQNFGRYYYNIRQCAAADLGTMTWLAMHCDSELDWICKIPRGTTALGLLWYRSECISPGGMLHGINVPFIAPMFSGSTEKDPEASERQSYLFIF